MGFMGQKKFGDGMKYFCFQVRFRGLETLTSFTVMRLATPGYADEIFSQNILQDSNA